MLRFSLLEVGDQRRGAWHCGGVQNRVEGTPSVSGHCDVTTDLGGDRDVVAVGNSRRQSLLVDVVRHVLGSFNVRIDNKDACAGQSQEQGTGATDVAATAVMIAFIAAPDQIRNATALRCSSSFGA
jgi:hypothetical protein